MYYKVRGYDKLVQQVADDIFCNNKITMMITKDDWFKIVKPAILASLQTKHEANRYQSTHDRAKRIIDDFEQSDLIF